MGRGVVGLAVWKYIAARTTGRSHLLTNQVCQDRFVCSSDLAGWILVAVADGAGSASFADIGAEVAAASAVAELETAIIADLDPLEAVRSAMAAAKRSVEETADGAGHAPRDYACTLLIVALGPEGGAGGQVGDGLIAVRDSDDGWTWVFWPQRGEYANVTRFLTEDEALTVAEFSALKPAIKEFAVMTDGLEPLALHYETRTAHTPFYEGIASHLRHHDQPGLAAELSQHLEAFLASPRIADRVDDDLTLVLAARCG